MPLVHDSNSGAKANANAALAVLIAAAKFSAASAHLWLVIKSRKVDFTITGCPTPEFQSNKIAVFIGFDFGCHDN